MEEHGAVDDTTSRVPPLPRPWSAEDAEAIGRWGHPAATYPPLLLTRVLQRHPGLADRTRHLGEGLYVDGLLSPRLRTLAILRTCALVGSTYEWGGQAAFWGPLTHVSDDEADALTAPDAGDAHAGEAGDITHAGEAGQVTWSEVDRAVIDAVDELEATGSLGEDRWAGLRAHLSDEQVLELLIVHGWYRMIATITNALDLGLEDWMRPWPADS